jgi:hypothetical protein
MFAHGREAVSAQCLKALVDAGASVSRQCLASAATMDRGVLKTVR